MGRRGRRTGPDPRSRLGESFVGRMRELGWIEGRTVEFLKQRRPCDNVLQLRESS
jgi:hypothetical protein